ncbi:MAG: DUF4339 domain-containing protein, partial [Bdellovibrionaceae bacterium]|nr:DUF4339 domain-containing protein [Pseudobdellovibrionaceae bacterium]
IQKGEMTLMDLIFKEGAPQWMPAQSFSEITELIGNITLNDSSDWIVLKTVNVDGKNIHEQVGPYNAQQILDLLDKGKIRFSDYVWRTGYDKWVPLGRVDQFEKPLKSSVEVDLSLYSKPRHVDLSIESVPVKKIASAPVPKVVVNEEPKPQEASGEDLVATKWKIPTATEPAVKIAPRKEKSVESKKDVEKKSSFLENNSFMSREAVDLAPPDVPVVAAPSKPGVKSAPKRTPPVPQHIDKKKTTEPTSKEVDRVAVAVTVTDNNAVIENELEVILKKPHRQPPPQQRATVRVETVRVETVPADLKKQESAVVSSPFKEEVLEKKDLKNKSDRPVVEKIESAGEQLAAVPSEKKEKTRNRWMQVGVAACVLVILFAGGILTLIGKKKISSERKQFSIKIETPPALNPAPRPVPSMGEEQNQGSTAQIKEDSLVANPSKKNTTAAPKQVGQQKPALVPQKEYSTAPTIGGSLKNRSYYHHKERIYLFYTSSEGEQLVSDLQKASKKHEKSAKQWQTFYGGWKGKVKTYSSKVSKEARKARLHRNLFRQLATSATELEDLGRDFNSQMSAGRGPSKVASAKSLEAQFKTIGTSARTLDR